MGELLSYAANVSTQVAILFIMIGVGFVLSKVKMIKKDGAAEMTNLLLYIVTPCVVLKAFTSGEVVYSASSLRSLLVAAGAAVLTHAVALAVGAICFRRCPKEKKSVFTAAVLLSNCGFMSLPLTEAVLGSEGVFIVTVYIGVFNVVLWTIGVKLFSSDGMTVKKAFVNPGVISAVVGITLFLCRVTIADLPIIYGPIELLSGLNAPLAMVVIGYYLAQTDLRPHKGDGAMFAAIALRLVAVPLVTLFALWAFGVKGTLLSACVIPASAPVAAVVMMFSAKFGEDTDDSSKIVSISHIFSIVTMPLMLTVCRYVEG